MEHLTFSYQADKVFFLGPVPFPTSAFPGVFVRLCAFLRFAVAERGFFVGNRKREGFSPFLVIHLCAFWTGSLVEDEGGKRSCHR